MKTLIRFVLLTFVISGVVKAQNEDEMQIPVEEDNQFPPENHDAIDSIHEGSGAGVIEDPVDKGQVTLPPLEDIESRVLQDNSDATTSAEGSNSCPSPCVCNTEGEDFVVDCSGYELVVLPTPIDTRTTILNINNNKLLEIPITISSLKNLKVLNADNNKIQELVPGSVSELPELVTLKVADNRLLEYPQDLKNAISLSKLQEVDLGGNDIRSTLTAELFSNFKQLKKLTLPVSNTDLLQNLCGTLKDSLETICTGKCSDEAYECPDAPQAMEEELIAATTSLPVSIEENEDPEIGIDIGKNESTTVSSQQSIANTSEDPLIDSSVSAADNISKSQNTEEVLRSPSRIAPLSAVVVAPKETTNNEEVPVKVGATTTADTKTGGVDKTLIGLIIAGMVVIIAGITLKKNWGSIKKRFSSTPRTPERTANGTNGTVPEEVPLQDKSPV